MSYATISATARANLIRQCQRVADAGHRATEGLGANNALATTTRLGNTDVTIDAQIAALKALVDAAVA